MPLKLVALLVFISIHGFAGENHFILMGGGGEKEGPTTIFDQEVKNTGAFVKNNPHWRPRVSFNGGHSETEEILKETFEPRNTQNTPFSTSSYHSNISRIKEELESGELKEGDQLLIQISSHGAISQPGEKSHSVSANQGATEDLVNLSNSRTVSLDSLQEIASLAESQGVKLAVLDFSCHSGSSIALANSKTCVITSTGPNHFGWAGPNSNGTFQAQFTKKMQQGKSLEDIFLDALDNKNDTGFPMISSPLGIQIQEETYPALTPYLYDARSELTEKKLDQYLEEEVRENKCRQMPALFSDLIAFSLQMEQIVKKKNLFFTQNADYSGLRRKLERYFSLQTELLNILAKKDFEQFGALEQFCQSYTHTDDGEERSYRHCSRWTIEEILMGDFVSYKELLERQLKDERDPLLKVHLEAGFEVVKQARARKAELLKEDPSLVHAVNLYERIPDFREKSKILAHDVARTFSQLYVDVYKAKMKKEDNSNPCRDFIL